MYQHLFLLKTEALLHRHSQWVCPDDFRGLIEAVYGEGSDLEAEIDAALLERAKEQFRDLQQELRDLGARALIEPPRADEARFTESHELIRDEAEEGEKANPLVASTRHGDNSRTVYALPCSEALRLCLLAERPPHRDKLRELMKRKVSLPAYWLAGADRHGEFFPIERAPQWLGFGDILWLREEQWLGEDANGRVFRVRYSSQSGFHREVSHGEF